MNWMIGRKLPILPTQSGPPPVILPTLIQHVMGGSNPSAGGTPDPPGGNGNAYKFSLPNAVGAGNCLILGLSYNSGLTISSISDGLNTWSTSPAVSADAGAGNMLSGIWVLKNATAGVTTITVTFTTTAVSNFRYKVSEFNDIDTTNPVDGTHGTGGSPISGTASLSVGSFTPTTNNNANGGHLIYADFSCSNTFAASDPSSWVPGGSFSLLDASIDFNAGQGLPHSAQYFVQATNAAINPSTVATGDTSDSFNCVAVALKAAAAGTPAPAGMRIISIHHFSTENFPTAAGTWVVQCPCSGNLRYLTGTDPNNTITSITDNASGTWQQVGAITGCQHWFAPNTGTSSSMLITVHGSSGDAKQSWRFVDIAGAAVSPLDTGVNATGGLSGAVVWDNAPTISPTSATGGILIANLGLGLGPGLGFDTGAPAGAIFDLIHYTNQTDNSYMDNSDLMGHISYPPGGGTYHWNWTITSQTGNSGAGGAVAFKSA